ncbi:zinc-binding dehydrogenase [bacterium]|nr:zinc-binding dehydrogenase [bacterium]
MKTRIAMWYAPMDLRLEEKEIGLLQEGEILVNVKAALTCGTDVKIYKRGHPLITPPFPLGHEFSGIVVDVGKNVDKSLIGKKVVTSNVASCHRCFYCKRGLENLCKKHEILYGAFADYIKIPKTIVEQNLQILPEDMDFLTASLVEPLSCALHGVNRANINIGDTVSIIGAGPMGLLMTQLCKLRGATVIMVDKSQPRLDIARQLGADYIINADNVKDVVTEVRNLTPEGKGVDVSIEAVGLPETWEEATKFPRKGGTVILYGGCASGTKISIDTELIHYSELTIKGSFNTTAYEIEVAFNLLRRKEILAENYVSGKFPLEDVERALKMHMKQQGIKYAIIP